MHVSTISDAALPIDWSFSFAPQFLVCISVAVEHAPYLIAVFRIIRLLLDGIGSAFYQMESGFVLRGNRADVYEAVPCSEPAEIIDLSFGALTDDIDDLPARTLP